MLGLRVYVASEIRVDNQTQEHVIFRLQGSLVPELFFSTGSMTV